MMRIHQGKVGTFWLRTTVLFLAVLVMLLGVSTVATLATIVPAMASTPCGQVLVKASDWLGGHGVDVRSNGADINTGKECDPDGEVYNLSANPPQYGFGWVCVELVNRLYVTKGWSTRLTIPATYNGQATNYGAKWLYTLAAAGYYRDLVAHANGSNYKPVPGDMIVHSNGTYGHVTVVDHISGNTLYAVDQNRSANGWESYTYNSSTGAVSMSGVTISGYVHSTKNTGSSGSSWPRVVAVSRASTNMAVFYDDGNGGLVSRSWDVNLGWSTYTWHDTFGTGGTDVIAGQPCAVARDSSDMDIFYRTAGGRLIHRGWNATYGWEGPDVLLSSGDAGDPACNARDSGDLVAFFRTNAGEIKSVSWNWQSGWNINPQFLYGSGATGDLVAISRTLDSMDVFFGKNNGNLVHLGWTAAYGWNITDWTVGSALTGRPTAITRNGGGDMSCFYQLTFRLTQT